jgi:hypothetical protein
MKIAGARVENKRLAPGLAIFMLSGAPTAHEVLSEELLWLQQVRWLCGSIRLGLFNKNSGSVPE